MNELMHGTDWSGQDLSGWLAQEKLDGCRFFWDGSQAWSRQGRAIELPSHYRMPTIALDCELYCGVGQLVTASNCVRLGPKWWTPTTAVYVFDAPVIKGDWLARITAATIACIDTDCRVIPFSTVRSTADAVARMAAIQAVGGEGLILRAPGLQYKSGRSYHMVKLKTAEALAA